MKTLFPDMDREIREDRTAAKREKVQRARDYLRGRDLSWLINYLMEHGPTDEHRMMLELIDQEKDEAEGDVRIANLLRDLIALWRVRKLWRVSRGIHLGSGEKTFLWGIRNVHERPAD